MPSTVKGRQIKPAKDGQPQAPKPADSRSGKRQASARISAACEACKKRKTKCTGGPPPCQLCQSLGTECVIDLSLDMRRRAALQRTVDESKSYQEALNRLIECIRDGNSPHYEQLLDYVRGGASNEDVIAAVQHSPGALEDNAGNASLLHISNPELRSPSDETLVASSEDRDMVDADSTERQSSSPFELHKEKESAGEISSLLSQLKHLPTTDGELLLRQILNQYSSPKQFNAGYTAAQHSLNSFSRNTTVPTSAERAMWHPALHLRSQPAGSEEQRQRGQNGPLQRRYTEHSVSISNSGSSPSTEPASSQPSSSHAVPRQPLRTNTPWWPAPLKSPITPYVETTRRPPLKYPEENAWDWSVSQENQLTELRIPVHLVLPLIVADDSYLSNVYTDYVQGARQMLESGVPIAEVLGSSDEVSMELFFRSRTETDTFDCASWACEVCRALPVLEDPIRMANAYMLTMMMRWLLAPTQANYAKVPDMMKPTPSQRTVPHIGAIEILPLGPLRDALIFHMRDWLSPLGHANWSLNWPSDLNAAVEYDPVTNTRRLTTEFINHFLEYNNWSISREFLAAFPELSGRIRVHD